VSHFPHRVLSAQTICSRLRPRLSPTFLDVHIYGQLSEQGCSVHRASETLDLIARGSSNIHHSGTQVLCAVEVIFHDCDVPKPRMQLYGGRPLFWMWSTIMVYFLAVLLQPVRKYTSNRKKPHIRPRARGSRCEFDVRGMFLGWATHHVACVLFFLG